MVPEDVAWNAQSYGGPNYPRFGGPDIVDDWLARAGCDVNDRDAEGNPLLNMVVMSNSRTRADVDLARQLVARGADVDARSGDGWTPLNAACIGSQNTASYRREMVALLLSAGADVNEKSHTAADVMGGRRTPLWYAFDSGVPDLEIVTSLLRAGAHLDSCKGNESIETVQPYNTFDRPGYDASFDACMAIITGVRKAGSYAKYAQPPLCKDVMVLRALALRGRAAPKGPAMTFVCRAPNEIAWHVLGFWPAAV